MLLVPEEDAAAACDATGCSRLMLRLAAFAMLATAAACRHATSPPPTRSLTAAPCGAIDDTAPHAALTREAERRIEGGARWTILLESWNTHEPLLGYALVSRGEDGVRAVRGLWSGRADAERVPEERVAILDEAVRTRLLRSDLHDRGISDGTCYVVTVWTMDSARRFITYEPASGYGASSIEPRLVRALGEHADHFLGVWQGPDSVPSKDGSR